jgi:hypothetical protein
MSVATEATRCDKDRIPHRVKVMDNDRGETIYVQAGKAPRPTGDADLKYDEFHPDKIGLGTKDGNTLLQQAAPGLPTRAVMSVYLQPPTAVAAEWEPYGYFYYEKE